MREVVSEEEVAKLDNYALRSFVEDNPRLSWCVMDEWMDGWMDGYCTCRLALASVYVCEEGMEGKVCSEGRADWLTP